MTARLVLVTSPGDAEAGDGGVYTATSWRVPDDLVAGLAGCLDGEYEREGTQVATGAVLRALRDLPGGGSVFFHYTGDDGTEGGT